MGSQWWDPIRWGPVEEVCWGQWGRVQITDRAAKVILGEVVLAHVLHELAVHAEDDEHLELLVREKSVALGEHVAGAAQHALAERLPSALSAPIWPCELEAMSGMRP